MDNNIISLVRYFNTSTSFEKVLSLNEYQIGQLSSSIEQLGVDAIKAAFDRAERSLFLSGKKVPKWKASFGWLIKCENLKNILSGKYDDFKRTRVMLTDDICESSLDSADKCVDSALARGFEDMFDNR